MTILRSMEGVGSTFLCEIPDQPAQPFQPLLAPRRVSLGVLDKPTTDKKFLKGARILVVDDAPDNRLLIASYLKRLGAHIDTAVNGLDGYQKAMASNCDIVLMDLQMPEMDGYVATQKLRAAGFSKPVIALTAHAMTETRNKCLDIGCNDHLAKPIDFPQLVATIARYLQSDRTS